MSKFVDEAMYLAEAMADRACGTECGEFVAKEREALRAAITAREALLERMAEALLGLKKSFPTEDDLHESGWDQVDIDEACSAYEASRAAPHRLRKGQAMSRVYLLMKHPRSPYTAQLHLKAGECLGVFAGRAEPDRIASEKNARKPSYLYTVQCKQVKESQ